VEKWVIKRPVGGSAKNMLVKGGRKNIFEIRRHRSGDHIGMELITGGHLRG